MSDSRAPEKSRVGPSLAVFAASLVLVGHWLFLRLPLVGDEPVHLAQVLRFVHGESGMHPWLTTFPTFHWLASWIVRAWGSDSANTVRIASTLLGILVLPAAYTFALAIHADRRAAAWRAVGVTLLPILLPYIFFIYTDALALAAVLAAASANERRRFVLAGAFGLLAVALRQTAIVWFAWLFVNYAWRERIWDHPRERWRKIAGQSSLFVATGVALLVFLATNGGIAIGDASSHPLGMYDQNLLFFLALVTIVSLSLLPMCAADVCAMVRRRPMVWLAASLAVALWFQFGWRVDHPYNLLPYHLHNDVAIWLNDADHRVLVLPFVIWALLTLCNSLRPDVPTWSWAAATVLLLTPSWMVEHRYSITPLAIWLLIRPLQNRQREGALVAWIALLGVGAMWISTKTPYGL